MNPAAFSLRKRTLMVVLMLVVAGSGVVSYQRLGRLEDPTFTIKIALVATAYPGASPREVEEEVTDRIEEAIQSMEQVKEVWSTSQAGDSYVFVEIKDTYRSSDLPQVWDELRRKVADVQGALPPGAGPSRVMDDFGDVYGVFFALTGKGYTPAQLKDYADTLKKELLLCTNVARIAFWGVQPPVIYVEFKRARLAELGLTPAQIHSALQAQNAVTPSGNVELDGDYVRITPTGNLDSEAAIANLLIGGQKGLVRLGDLADIYRGYTEPPHNLMRYNGAPAIGIGISTMNGGNVIEMGNAIKQRLAELAPLRPAGMELHAVYVQSDTVAAAVSLFVRNLKEALVIIIVPLMLFMGWQSGLLLGAVMLLTILATFTGMYLLGIDLQLISLGALIISLGMLVDDAIVIADGILVRVEQGEAREQAAMDVVRDTQWPLFGATLIAVLAFAALGFSSGDVGEFCISLLYVLALALAMSWVHAVTVTPLLCVWFLRIPKHGQETNAYDGRMFRAYRRFVDICLRGRWLVVGVTDVLLAASVFAFRLVPQFFFADSTLRLCYVDLWLPQGTHIGRTARELARVEAFLRGHKSVTNVTSVIGEGALRFMLSYDYHLPNSSYGQLLVEATDYRAIDDILADADAFVRREIPDAEPCCKKIPKGPAMTFLVEARFRGSDRAVLIKLAGQAEAIMRAMPQARDVRTDWRQEVKVIRPRIAEEQARRVGVSRDDLAQALQWSCNGAQIGTYREHDDLIPIMARPPVVERSSATQLDDVQIWSTAAGTFVPLRQVVAALDTAWEAPLIQRRNRQRTVTVQCNPVTGLASSLLKSIKPQIEAIPLPPGYSFKWGGEYDQSEKAQEPIRKSFPLCLLGMFLIIVCLFNSIRKSVIVFLVVPLSIIGMTAGLLIFHLPFGFMAILGFIGLSGMLIRNSVVLVSQINLDLAAGKPPYQAVVDASVSRLRPVLMTAGATIFGMTPLVRDPFYASMAVTIMGGLLLGTLMTLVVVPALYCLFYRVKPIPLAGRAQNS
ncbi:MAG: efflux RND transporter permease subunit [bacterium]|nr:efflux RND transporter permease subunit [bacterium]